MSTKSDANSLAVLPSNATEVELVQENPLDQIVGRVCEFLTRIGMQVDDHMRRLLADTLKSGAYFGLQLLRDGQLDAEGDSVPFSMQELMDMCLTDNSMLSVLSDDMSEAELQHTIDVMDETELPEDQVKAQPHDCDEVTMVTIPANRTLH